MLKTLKILLRNSQMDPSSDTRRFQNFDCRRVYPQRTQARMLEAFNVRQKRPNAPSGPADPHCGQYKQKKPTPQPLRVPRSCARAPRQHTLRPKNGKGVTIAVAAPKRRRRLPGGCWE